MKRHAIGTYYDNRKIVEYIFKAKKIASLIKIMLTRENRNMMDESNAREQHHIVKSGFGRLTEFRQFIQKVMYVEG